MIPVEIVPIRTSVTKRSTLTGLEEYIKKFIHAAFINPKIRPIVNPLFNDLTFVRLIKR